MEIINDPQQPALGRFARARQPFRRGALVFKEAAPLLRVASLCHSASDDVLRSVSALRNAGLFEPAADSRALRDLRLRSPAVESVDALFIRTVLHFNSFAAGPNGRDQVVFSNLSMINHSCFPNCIVDGDEGTLRATQDIAAGEELTVSYLNDGQLLWPRERRRNELQQRWDFICHCRRCSEGVDDVRCFNACSSTLGCSGLLHAVQPSEARVAGGYGVFLRCAECKEPASASQTQLLLAAEASATRALLNLQSGDLEDEDEGPELLKCQRFAVQHPCHSLALCLAHDFDYAFTDVRNAKRELLQSVKTLFGDALFQLTTDVCRELADLEAARGDMAAAQKYFEAAATTACALDGKDSNALVALEWAASATEASQGSLPAQRVVGDFEDIGNNAPVDQRSLHPRRTAINRPVHVLKGVNGNTAEKQHSLKDQQLAPWWSAMHGFGLIATLIVGAAAAAIVGRRRLLGSLQN
mmetsp:Transcript_76413/g.151177  ORF Transcript_76413/g.151177 Transcript_76413/m.151177 type:complete len:471 (+) Transcript_76413:83-1495(+)|eukprot:CAMPEP_0172676022 /NCGR_PEP_ID=MMETSP1074-20121228/13658_1 /TAXON_ID=2916 /ORGANISM="Ceratium fusus, Strain PA161109" /LENGTH=470 /DNA_ID=CAMNT_0013493575 /DNA_START=74 /DNA_END=1486 /DNA_ORIENTATION=-